MQCAHLFYPLPTCIPDYSSINMYLTLVDRPRMPQIIQEFVIKWHTKVEINVVFMFAALLISARQGAFRALQKWHLENCSVSQSGSHQVPLNDLTNELNCCFTNCMVPHWALQTIWRKEVRCNWKFIEDKVKWTNRDTARHFNNYLDCVTCIWA